MDFKTFKKEADKYRTNNLQRKFLTKEQEEFIILCRDHENPISFVKMGIIWGDMGWGKIGKSALQEWATKLKAQGKIK